MLPILHLNGFKIANPTLLARISGHELTELLRGYGYDPHFVEGDDPALVHQSLAATLDKALIQIRDIQTAARAATSKERVKRPRWPMIVFRTPKGWGTLPCSTVSATKSGCRFTRNLGKFVV